MKKIVGGLKDENGIFVPHSQIPDVPRKELSIPDPGTLDEIGETIILALSRAVKKITQKIINEDDVSREVIGALKDCEAMHRELSKKEKEFLASLTNEELAELAATPFTHDPAEKIIQE